MHNQININIYIYIIHILIYTYTYIDYHTCTYIYIYILFTIQILLIGKMKVDKCKNLKFRISQRQVIVNEWYGASESKQTGVDFSFQTRISISQMLHGAGIFTYMIFDDFLFFWRKFSSPMERVSLVPPSALTDLASSRFSRSFCTADGRPSSER